MAELESRNALAIVKFPHGGFAVREAYSERLASPYLFACDDIDSALAWIKQAMHAEKPQIVPDGFDLHPGAINRVG